MLVGKTLKGIIIIIIIIIEYSTLEKRSARLGITGVGEEKGDSLGIKKEIKI